MTLLAPLLQSRNLMSFVYGSLITFVLFWFLQMLITGGKGVFEKIEPPQPIDFIRLKKDSDLELRTRVKPPKPPPPKNPPPPRMTIPTPAPTPQEQTPLTMPKMQLATGISGGPFLGGYTATDAGFSGDGDLIPFVRISPSYPPQAQRDGIEGEVMLEVTVGPDGTVKDVRVKSAKPRGVFEQAAIVAARKGRFRPKVVDGKPQETKGVYKVIFKLGEQ